MRTYPTGYIPAQEALFQGPKCYRNTFGLFIHNSRNVTVTGGLFADNMLGVDIDRDDTTKLVNSKVIGESDSYRALMAAKRLSEKVCNDPHIGVELHTEMLTEQSKSIAIENVEFSKFSHVRCSDAVPMQYDSSVSALWQSREATLLAADLTFALCRHRAGCLIRLRVCETWFSSRTTGTISIFVGPRLPTLPTSISMT
jgi:hypothetical protein